MGWTGIIVPEEYGGSNLGHLTFGVILEETGRQLTASPLLASALAGASAILLGGSEAQKRKWLPGIVDGNDGFGLIAFASLFPIMSVMAYAQLAQWRQNRERHKGNTETPDAQAPKRGL